MRMRSADRLMREQRERAAQLKSIASKGYRAAVSANSPKRRRSPGRSPQEDSASPSNEAPADATTAL
jgi:hypothetical protein